MEAKRPQNLSDLGWADGLLLLTALFWGVNISAVKFALAELSPLAFNGLRFLLAAVAILLLAWLTGHSLKFQRHHLIYLVGLGLLANTAYQLFFIFGLDNTTADNSSLILATVPVWVALGGALTGTERMAGQGWLGVVLSLIGIGLIILGSNHAVTLHFGQATLLGDGLILMAALCWSVYTLASRPMFRHYSSATVTGLSTLLGSIPIVLLSIPALGEINWPAVSWPVWAGLTFSGLFSITLAYIFWNYGVARLGGARTALYSNLVPPVALLAAWLILGETLTLQQWLGGLLALGGVILARRFTYPSDQEPVNSNQ